MILKYLEKCYKSDIRKVTSDIFNEKLWQLYSDKTFYFEVEESGDISVLCKNLTTWKNLEALYEELINKIVQFDDGTTLSQKDSMVYYIMDYFEVDTYIAEGNDPQNFPYLRRTDDEEDT